MSDFDSQLGGAEQQMQFVKSNGFADGLENKEFEENPEIEDLTELTPREMAKKLSKLRVEGKLEDYLLNSFKSDSNIAYVSYYAKWLYGNVRTVVEKVIQEKRDVEEKGELPLNLDRKYTPKQLQMIFHSVVAIQLTYGCSFGCPRCCFDAVKGVKEKLDKEQVKKMFEKYGKFFDYAVLCLHFASEPSDHPEFEEIYQLASQLTPVFEQINFITRTEDEHFLEFVQRVNKTRSLNNATHQTLSRQEENERGLKHPIKTKIVKESISPHKLGWGISRQAGYENLNTNYVVDAGVIITPRGSYNVLKTKKTEMTPQCVLVVPINKLEETKTTEEIRVGTSVKEIMQNYIVHDVVPRIESERSAKDQSLELIVAKERCFFYVFPNSGHGNGKIVYYNPSTLEVKIVEEINFGFDEYRAFCNRLVLRKDFLVQLKERVDAMIPQGLLEAYKRKYPDSSSAQYNSIDWRILNFLRIKLCELYEILSNGFLIQIGRDFDLSKAMELIEQRENELVESTKEEIEEFYKSII